MKKLNLLRLADVKAYIGLLDREEITMSRFAEILNECANEALRIHDVSKSTKVDKPKLSVKCLHCGRQFIGKMPHKCNTGYRKRNHSWQEITED